MAKAKKEPADEEQNLPVVQEGNEWEAALRAAGFISPAMGGKDINRLKIAGQNIYNGDELIATSTPGTKGKPGTPALIVQLMDAPRQYQSLWFDKRENAHKPESNGDLAAAVGRDGTQPGIPSIEGRFCKSHFDKEDEARRFAEDGTSCDTCPVHPFVPKDQLPPEAKGKKCSWRADVEFRILEKNEDGNLEAVDDTIWTVSLSTTGVIEFVGSSGRKNDPLAGSVSEKNTMAQIAMLGYQKWGNEGILKARTMLSLGGVICELYILPAKSKDGSIHWTVPSFRPIEILEQEETPALPDSSGDGTVEDESVPF